MEDGQRDEGARPETSLTPPPEGCNDAELLKYLLKAEKGRLEVALQIERDRETVFPETTVIIRDIQKLHATIQRLASKRDDVPSSELDELIDEVGG